MIRNFVAPFVPHVGVECRTMLDEFNDVELSGADVPPRASDDDYMFPDAEHVDMDAYCDPDVNVLKMGVSVDEHSYFGDVASRLGLENQSNSNNSDKTE